VKEAKRQIATAEKIVSSRKSAGDTVCRPDAQHVQHRKDHKNHHEPDGTTRPAAFFVVLAHTVIVTLAEISIPLKEVAQKLVSFADLREGPVEPFGPNRGINMPLIHQPAIRPD
jgi:hypothetical protein